MCRIRVAQKSFMDNRDLASLGWAEEADTEVAIHRGRPAVRVVQFNRWQEGPRHRRRLTCGGGFDRASTECFGMLVQRTNSSRRRHRWIVDISHRAGGQLKDHLLNTARQFQVRPGTPFHGRTSLPAAHCVLARRNTRHCVKCRRMAIR